MNADRPTPETDAHFARQGFRNVYTTDEDFAKGLERQRDEAREMARTNYNQCVSHEASLQAAREDYQELEAKLKLAVEALDLAVAIFYWISPERIEAAHKRSAIKHNGNEPFEYMRDTLAAIKAGKEGA